jgi:GR25 family glycosyltransferase involved in LPS biosynthesis
MYFPIFILNLDSATERMKRMDRRMKRYDLSYTRISASTPNDIQGTFVHYLSGAQKACTYSHIRVLQHIVDSNMPVALILEDDASFRKDWLSILNTKVAALQFEDPNWDCVFLNVAEGYDVNEKWHVARDQCLSAAYLIRHHAAKWMLDHHKQMYFAIDWMTQVLQRRGHSYTYYPWLVIQEGRDSFNTSNLDADRAKVERLLFASKYGLEHYDF